MRPLAMFALVLAGCGSSTANIALVADGTYNFDLSSAPGHTDAEFTGTVLTINLTAHSATLVPTNGAPITAALTATSRDLWISDCFTNNSHSLDEVYRIAPDPLVIGSLSIPSPVVTTKCGGRVLIGTYSNGALGTPYLGFLK